MKKEQKSQTMGCIYARYSSVNQTEQSIDGQLRECKEYADRHGISIVTTYIDRAFSAKTDNRPEFQQMIKDSAKNTFTTVLVWKLDRFARNRYDSANYKRTLRKNGVKVVSVTETIADDSTGILLESMLEGYAEFYSAELAEKVRRGMNENALKCKWNGGTRPLGYTPDENGMLAINPIEGNLIRKAFTMYSNGGTMAEIVDLFNNELARTQRGGKYKTTTVSNILRNERYLGIYKYGAHRVIGGIPQIIDNDTFDKVQLIIKSNKIKHRKCKQEVNYMLTGKLFCGLCKSPMSGDSGTSRNGSKYLYYTCIAHKKEHTCDKKSVRKEILEKMIIDETVKQVLTPERIDFFAKRMYEMRNDNVDVTLIKKLKQEVKECEKSLQNIQNGIEQGIILPNTQERVNELTNKIGAYNVEIARSQIKKSALSLEQIERYLYKYVDGDVDSTKFAQSIIQELVSAIYVYEDKIIIAYCIQDDNLKDINDLEIAISDNCSGVYSLAQHSSLYPNIIFLNYGFAIILNLETLC